MDRWKAEQGRGREKRKIRREKIRRERVRRKKMQMREKVGKSRNTVFFQWFEAPEGRKVGSLSGGCGASWPDERWKFARHCGAKQISKWKCTKHNRFGHFWKFRCRKSALRCGAKHIYKSKCTKQPGSDHFLEVAISKKCTPLWREAHFQVKMYKTHQDRTTFGSSDVEKVHAVVARSTFRSENVQNTTCSRHFWRFRCRKSARCLWHEAHFEVKMYKALGVRTTFGGSDVEKVHAVVARSTFRSENVQSTRGSDHFWRFRCRLAASLHYTTLRYITPHSTILHYITLHYTPQHYNYNYTTRLHSTTLHYIKFHYTTLH